MNNLIGLRNDLRIAHNKALKKACDGETVIPIYLFDPRLFAIGDFGFKKNSVLPEGNLRDKTTKLIRLKDLGLCNFTIDSKTDFPFSSGEGQASLIELQII